MSIIESLIKAIQSTRESVKAEVPEGLCPNCWGHQEYSGKFYEAVLNHKVDINSQSPNVGWIQDYAEKNLKGIQLEYQDDMLVCPKCKLTYRPT